MALISIEAKEGSEEGGGEKSGAKSQEVASASASSRAAAQLSSRPAQNYKGTVKFFDDSKGYGFIAVVGMTDVYVSRTEIGEFSPGDTVVFATTHSAKHARMVALNLRRHVEGAAESSDPPICKDKIVDAPEAPVRPSNSTASSSRACGSRASPGSRRKHEVVRRFSANRARRGFSGVIKSFDSNKGFGFISCWEAYEQFGRDVFLHSKQIKDFAVGDAVMFNIRKNDSGHPQAYGLLKAPQTVSWLTPEDFVGGSSSVCTVGNIEDHFEGKIKSFSVADGYGFIDCPELFRRFNRDVFVHGTELNGAAIGGRVSFQIEARAGRPRARNIALLKASAGSTEKDRDALGDESSALNRKLLRACASARVESVQEMERLLDAGANPDARDVTGQAALMIAALNVRHGERKCRTLMHYGADPMMLASLDDEDADGDEEHLQTILEWMRERINPKMEAYIEALFRGKDPDCDTMLDMPDDEL